MPTLPSKHISIDIDCPYAKASRFLENPSSFSQWAAGLGGSLRREDERWLTDTPAGLAEIRFSPPNEYGILDHWVHFRDGMVVYVPLRVIASGDGCEVTLTLLRVPGMSDAKFAEDAEWVSRDLARLKAVLESS